MPERPVAFDKTLVRITLRRVLLVTASLTLALFGWFLLDESDAVNAQEKNFAATGRDSFRPSAALLGSEAEIVAEVDGRPITRADLDRQVAAELSALYQVALGHAIDERLLAAEARRRGVAPEELNALSTLEREKLLHDLRRGASVRIHGEKISTAANR